MAGNRQLTAARNTKNDEFYTQLTDIEKEMRYYRKHFEGKTIFCNCDDPFESNFFKYFVLNFNRLGLKKLIATCYVSSPIANTQLSLFDVIGTEESKQGKPYKAIVTKVYDKTGDGGVDMFDVAELFKSGENILTELDGDGDFRSSECLELLDESDIVVTNPPFSLFRQYVSTLIEHNKSFIIMGNKNAISYIDFFPLLMENKVWVGATSLNGGRWMIMPRDIDVKSSKAKINERGEIILNVAGVCWFTNLDIKQRHEEILLYKRYSPEEYPKYDNYDAINVDKIVDIPCDYSEIMGVPITFMDKYNPDQFEILGITLGNTVDYEMTTLYRNAIQHNKDGSTQGGGKVNTRAAILVKEKPIDTVYYTAEDVNGYLISIYPRILIRNKNPEQSKEKA